MYIYIYFIQERVNGYDYTIHFSLQFHIIQIFILQRVRQALACHQKTGPSTWRSVTLSTARRKGVCVVVGWVGGGGGGEGEGCMST